MHLALTGGHVLRKRDSLEEKYFKRALSYSSTIPETYDDKDLVKKEIGREEGDSSMVTVQVWKH